MTGHVPKPPLHTLEGRWTIERATPGEIGTVDVGGRTLRPVRAWILTVRHVESDTVAHANCRAVPRTTFAPGQEIEGRIVTTWEGDFFRRARPAVASRRRG